MSIDDVCGLAQSIGFNAKKSYIDKGDRGTRYGFYVEVFAYYGNGHMVGQGFWSRNNRFPLGNIQAELQGLCKT